MSSIEHHLNQTSRTFSIPISFLKEPLKNSVSIAYLLFRIVDTFEDATCWNVKEKIHCICLFLSLINTNDFRCRKEIKKIIEINPPTEHKGYIELLQNIPFIMEKFLRIEESQKHIIRTFLCDTISRMMLFIINNTEGNTFKLKNLNELHLYCYAVAGLVGKCLTELFIKNDKNLIQSQKHLRLYAPRFGEALQLTNILKDVNEDKKRHCSYLPKTLPLFKIFCLARSDIEIAKKYILTLCRSKADRGVIGFATLPSC